MNKLYFIFTRRNYNYILAPLIFPCPDISLYFTYGIIDSVIVAVGKFDRCSFKSRVELFYASLDTYSPF